MFPFAEQHVSSALTGMLNGATPLFAAIVASAFARKAPERAVVIGLGVGLSGAVLIALPSLSEGSNSLFGVLLILAALVSYGSRSTSRVRCSSATARSRSSGARSAWA